MKPKVAITKCETYQEEELKEALRLICSEAQLPCVKEKRVLIKPNILSDASPEKALTTRAEVIGALIQLLFEMGASEVLVGDSPGLSGPNFTPKTSKIAQVVEKEGATWCEFARNPVDYTIPNMENLHLPLPSIMEEVDCIISVAKMKTHQLMYATGCVKNLFGMVVGLHKSACHLRYPTRQSFATMLASLFSLIKPHFGIMDAVVAMEGPGPASGTPRHMGLLLASKDITALDSAQAIIMGYNPWDLPLIQELHHQGLTSWKTLQEIIYPLLDPYALQCSEYELIEIAKKKRRFVLPFRAPLTRAFRIWHQKKEPKPLFIDQKCIGCGKCVQICPAHALHLNEAKKVVADYNLCIRCYCCHEVCPADAIEIERRVK